MTSVHDLLLDATPLRDLSTTSLGDARLHARHKQIVRQMTLTPSASMPATFPNQAQLQAYYRFTQNPNVSHHDLLEPHFASTAQRASQLEHVHVLHDTTRIRFDVHDDFEREHLCRFGKGSQGFDWHCALVCAPGSVRAPLGLIASQPFVPKARLSEDTLAFWKQRDGVLDNEMERWMEGVERAELRLQACARVTHVMDREGDCFELLYAMKVSGYDAIVRAAYNRRVLNAAGSKLFEVLEQAPWLGERSIALSERWKSRATKHNPARRPRQTKVRVRAVEVELKRPQGVASAGPINQSVTCWAVELLESRPPKGEKPVRWVLLTSHEIDCVEQAWEVVDGYQGRWLIEEYNKALKTGCGVRQSQQRSAQALLKMLALAAPIAWYLLVLRYLSEYDEKAEAEQVLDELELRMLRALRPKLIKRNPKVRDVMLAMASLGGHVTRNGPPGWLTLERGRRKLADHVQGARLLTQSLETCDAS